MANKYFSKISKPRVSERTFDGLIGHTFPDTLNPNDDGAYGKYIDKTIKQALKTVDPNNGNPDLSDYDIELKSKKQDSGTNWTIATMTAQDIINTPYRNSPVFRKLQALLLVEHNTILVTDVTLTYLDNDDAQERIQDFYETVRNALSLYVLSNGYNFSDSQQFKHRIGVLEHNNVGQEFKFRLRQAHLDTMVSMSANVSIRDQFFEFS